MSKIFLLIFSTVFLNQNLSALEIDEKLPLRFLQVSGSKKTVLINRGLEDGLVVGDHAKFFVTTGVIARGVVVKASPSRSIWSLYRLVSPEKVQKSKVLNLKIASPVKLTDDPTKSLYSMAKQDVEVGEPVDIIKADMSGSEESEVGALMSENESSPIEMPTVSSKGHNLELTGLLSMSSFSGTYSSDAKGDIEAKSSTTSFVGSIEKYFPTYNNFFKKISIKGLLNYYSEESGQDTSFSTTVTDYGLGLSYYFGKGPFVRNRMMYFIDGSIGISSISITDTTDETLEGSGNFYSVGLGAKYLMGHQFGGVAKLDYYSNSSSFDVEDTATNSTETQTYGLSGPRVMFGLFYRFL